MHDIKFIRHNPDLFDQSLSKRGIPPISGAILDLDEKHRGVLTALQELQSRRNTLAKEFGMAKSKGLDTSGLSKESDEIKIRIGDLEIQEAELGKNLSSLLETIPNLPAEDCPLGLDEAANVEIRRFGEPKVIPEAKQHFEIGEALGLMDFERASKLSGSRFVVLYRDLARLERALATFMIDIHTQEFGYQEVAVPFLVHDAPVYGVGQLPKFHDDLFQTTSGHWLISTSEVSLTNLVAGEILDHEVLPLRYTAFTPCFRAEAGSAGRDTRGMIRQHQFSKVELVSIVAPEQAIEEHERMTTAAETILQRLELPYRVMALCAGDMGFAAQKTYDFEVWLPGQNAYREISSCSRCGDFQARRMNARYRPHNGDKPQFVNTLNGSGIAVGRTMVALLENFQNPDGSVSLPSALVPYMGGQTKIEKK